MLQLGIGRTLMGVGMACSVMAGLKAANLWFPPRRVPLLASFFFGMTGVGGMLATVPLAALLEELHRSEEHTSELQSLMRISYAVFCLKKKNNKNYQHIDTSYYRNQTKQTNR